MSAGDPSRRCSWCDHRGRDHYKSQDECSLCGCIEYDEQRDPPPTGPVTDTPIYDAVINHLYPLVKVPR